MSLASSCVTILLSAIPALCAEQPDVITPSKKIALFNGNSVTAAARYIELAATAATTDDVKTTIERHRPRLLAAVR